MQDSLRLVAEDICTGITRETGEHLYWQWDNRFDTALAQFNITDESVIRAVLDRYLSVQWDSSAANSAPVNIQNVLSRLGGLKGGQLFWTSSAEADEYVYCAWWPWGNGEKISIRLAPAWLHTQNETPENDVHMVMRWFGIDPD
ncbi:MAG: hypothetical protein OEZ23_05620 [Gammaproteobacteria bacterium]|nr:hypothetical protein [Gammaproteobacteria bacterium]